jgi:hypothetical protein
MLRPEEFPVAAIFPSVLIISDDVLTVIDPEPEDGDCGGPPLGALMLNKTFLTLFK